ncbi:lipase family protein [Aldersonia sp. NBC_00410]|uniref:alpha/beta hydrolase family protein n=1 Tax=Aldersonia sp. NBC_00410 TaxID=2975954 RepID=UPI002252303A|nr:lipase family protein [Aldersonia sp. NBC_00410]MCX5045545.1 lipase family protein [Aldersonia sp. NBC_00410]
MRSIFRASVGLAVALTALLGVCGIADAAPTPNWSGLDVREYTGQVPQAGTLIAQAALAPELGLPSAAQAYRIHYSTPDVHGAPATSTGAVFVPTSAPPPGGYPVIAWAHGTTGLGDDCTPSALPRSARDTAYLSHWLDQGYVVVSTDYVGLGTPGLMSYLSGQAEATSIVDSVKAAHQLGLPLANRWALVGQSQGAGAALNAAQRASALSAGTDLDYRGVVATGTPANFETLVGLAGPGFPPVALPAALNAYTGYIFAGFSDARPDLDVPSVLTQAGREVLNQARTLCYADMAALMSNKQFGTLFAEPLASIPGAQAALAEYMRTPYTGYDRPVFLGQGLRDTDVPAPSALSLYAQMLANNQPVELHIYPDQDHSGTVLASLPDSTPFVARILAP